ncbi:PorV/PorQ family protein [candidate division WOR-3 bacterium]|uniref:PorV/PorQ family protein n=1 Tax=candidate division WOR-3 bacterium TaxID=2052148 RepID=A0A9D5QCH4_UNCW3|nr:PorV/PorQ family protein [candidate division WOR-3 bacterium]MBD3363986.1 PorV/PorQ family protein [candidate division WOR-3 bacterium]
MKKNLIIFSVIVAVSFAQFGDGTGTTAHSVMKTGFGPRPAGMGSAYAGLATGVDALWWNPAGLYQLTASEVLVTHQEWISDIRDEYLAFAWPMSAKNSLGLGLNFSSITGIEHIDENNLPVGGGQEPETINVYDAMLALAYTRQIGESFGIGISLKGLYENLYQVTGFGGSADIGIHSRLTPSFSWGVVAQNLGGVTYGDSTYLAPIQARLGASLRYPALLFGAYFAADVCVPADNNISVHAGAEVWPFEMLALRAGYQTGPQDITPDGLGVPAGLTGGLGFAFDRFRIDYTIAPYGKLGLAHRFGLAATFGERPWKGSNNDKGDETEAFTATERTETDLVPGHETAIVHEPDSLPTFVQASGSVEKPYRASVSRFGANFSIEVSPTPQHETTECLVSQPYGLIIENKGDEWDIINID